MGNDIIHEKHKSPFVEKGFCIEGPDGLLIAGRQSALLSDHRW
jgi:hypothetical protein